MYKRGIVCVSVFVKDKNRNTVVAQVMFGILHVLFSLGVAMHATTVTTSVNYTNTRLINLIARPRRGTKKQREASYCRQRICSPLFSADICSVD